MENSLFENYTYTRYIQAISYKCRVSLSNIQSTFLYSTCLNFPTVLVDLKVVQYTVYLYKCHY